MNNKAKRWYRQAQLQNVRFDPKRLKNINTPQQQDPRVRTFQQAFTSLGLESFSQLSQSDALVLDSIQKEIRKKLRFFGVQVSF